LERLAPIEAASPPPVSAATLVEVLLTRAEAEPDRVHLYLPQEIGEERRITYRELLGSANAVPVCPMALRGTREYLWSGRWIPRRGSVHVVIGNPIIPKGKDWRKFVRLRETAKGEILRHCGEPALDRVAAEIPEE
jgi:1-acyl-sn-glycerol-3-phosphate acyltransferase